MARRRKNTSWLLLILLGVMAVALFNTSTTTPDKPNEDVTTDSAVVLTYENGVDFTNFIFNK